MKPTTKDAYKLMHEGALALAVVEANGIRIDEDRLNANVELIDQKITEGVEALKDDRIWKIWVKEFGSKANLSSRQQLGYVLFHKLDFKAVNLTPTGRPKVDMASLEQLGLSWTTTYLDVERYKKLKNTYLKGIQREVVGGYVHPSFNLNTTRTFRSSCNAPNFQNQINRSSLAKYIRECFIPRKNHVLVCIDYGALEFRVAACFWKDKAMVAYANDSDLDIHRDMAAACYLLDCEQVTKRIRFFAKNQFVFPTLYGSYWKNTARRLWAVMLNEKLELDDGTLLRDHLAAKGITELGDCEDRPIPGTFEHHIYQVESELEERFPQWASRKKVWWSRYLERGWFRTMTGFVCRGVMKKNDLYNWPIQGPAFHLLLWSLIRLVGWCKTNPAYIVGQIHDEIVGDVREDQVENFLKKAKQVMTQDVRDHWKWVITQLEVEAVVCRANWFEKEGVSI
ncbi:MAG: hypothetical protein GF411_03270 [Candidatus Lokiarchaeota archaeon]|nr:hypothetical protein [Candidatus Lokiarchaeota archaeon]